MKRPYLLYGLIPVCLVIIFVFYRLAIMSGANLTTTPSALVGMTVNTSITVQVFENGSTISSATNMSGVTQTVLDSNLSTTVSGYRPETKEEMVRDFWIGVGLAIFSALFTGTSFILKKLGLLRLQKKQALRAGDGGFQYLKEWLWWAGMILMILGELFNFIAYTFAPATVVTPLGALSVICSALMSTYFLKEHLNLLGKIGCLLCIVGSTVIVLNSPKEQEIHSMEELLDKLIEPGIIILCIILLIIALLFIFVVGPRYGHKNVVVYLVVCSTFGAFTVTGCKGLGVAIRETTLGKNEFTNWLTYVMIAVIIVCILFQLNYLNKSLDTFNTAIVTPTYYVVFTSIVIGVSLVLFKEFGHMNAESITGNFCGFVTIITGIFMLNAFKDMSISLKSLPKAQKRPPSHSSHNGDVMANVAHDDHHLLEDNENHSPDEDQQLRIVTEYHDDPKSYTEVFTEKDGSF